MQAGKHWTILKRGSFEKHVELVGIFRAGATARPSTQLLKGAEKAAMEFLMVTVLVLMLIAVAYAQWQRGVVRTIGKLSLDEEETDRTVR
jgi:hypothetical protein